MDISSKTDRGSCSCCFGYITLLSLARFDVVEGVRLKILNIRRPSVGQLRSINRHRCNSQIICIKSV
ncbi:hypothetical protein AAHA92_22981 [Salvia divinorum]|uniref:Uncharacterized protein n=1 Tax=Salvia divinorum TaxID=28513 RepID=A0ABD1GTB8_SALDI